jgi:hypothetical protein
MLRLSDLSGPGREPGFDTYLTGYALLTDSVFVLARTWYAQEMKRPGCVWTHSLLVRFEDLDSITSLDVILASFHRPTVGRPTTNYSQSLGFTELGKERISAPLFLKQPEALVARILSHLYAGRAAAVLVGADESGVMDRLALGIWLQQWPDLRRSFRFCTGSLAIRIIDGAPFDLQVIPRTRAGRLQRDVPEGVYVSYGPNEARNSESAELLSDWTSVAASEMLRGSKGRFQDFIWSFGQDAGNTRADFGNLASLFTELTVEKLNTEDLARVTSKVASAFPDSARAHVLKSLLLGADPVLPNFRIGLREADKLRVLATTDAYHAFDWRTLDLRSRAAALWIGDQSAAWGIVTNVTSHRLTIPGMMFLRGVADALDPVSASRLYPSDPQAVEALIRVRPLLATSVDLWRETDRHTEVLLALRRSRPSRSVLAAIGAAILRIPDPSLSTQAVEILGSDFTFALLDSISNGDLRTSDARPWLDALASKPEHAMTWLRNAEAPSRTLLRILIPMLNPSDNSVLGAGGRFWAGIADAIAKEAGSTDAMAILLAIGFRKPPDHPEDLVTAAFPVVYQAASEGNLSNGAWHQLETTMGAGSIWTLFMARAQRLLISLAEHFANNEWPARQLVRCVPDVYSLNRVIGLLMHLPQGRSLLDDLRQMPDSELSELDAGIARRIQSLRQGI